MSTKFSIEGFYNYDMAPGGKGKLTGEIEVAKDGSFEGMIYDHAHSRPNQLMKGHIWHDKDITRLLFLKMNDASNRANIAYEMVKPLNNDSMEGKYKGEWAALPFKVEYNKDLGFFTEKIDMSVAGIGDTAELNLTKK